MKHKLTTLLCLLMILMTCVPLYGYAETADGDDLHLFLGLPFDTATPDDVEQALLENYGVGWDPNYTYHRLRGITAFDHEFSFGIEFDRNKVGFKRIIMHPADRDIWADTEEEFLGMLQRDIADYILLEQQISAVYGEPTLRFFRTGGAQYHTDGVVKAMYSGGRWDADRMMEQIRADNGTLSYTVWDNIVLKYWVIWRHQGVRKSKSCIDLNYYSTLWAAGITPDSLAVYPPAGNDYQP